MRTVTYTIFDPDGQLVALLDGPEKADLAYERHVFRAAFGLPTFPRRPRPRTYARLVAEEEVGLGRAFRALGYRLDHRRPSEAALFCRWLIRERGFTGRPSRTYTYLP